MVYLTALFDKEFRGIKNCKDLARSVGIPRQDIIGFEQPKALESPTKNLLEYVAVTRPHFTLNHLKSALQEICRMDLVAIIDNYFDASKGNYTVVFACYRLRTRKTFLEFLHLPLNNQSLLSQDCFILFPFSPSQGKCII